MASLALGINAEGASCVCQLSLRELSINPWSTTDNSVHISFSKYTDLGQNSLLIEGEAVQGTVLQLQGLRKEGKGRWRNLSGHLGEGEECQGKQHGPGPPRGPEAARPAHRSPWLPHWSNWINHISHSLIGADNWRAGLCAQEMCSDRFGWVEQEEWGPPDFILCQGGRHKATVSPMEPGPGKAGGMENPVQTTGGWEPPGKTAEADDGLQL